MFKQNRKAEKPAPPAITVSRIERATSDFSPDCSASGLVELVINTPLAPESGYRFQLKNGVLPFKLPDLDIAPIGQTFRFRWRDLKQGETHLKPIDADIEVVEISRNGRESDPTTIHIHHLGSGTNED